MGILVNLYQVSKAFGAKPLFEDLTFSINEGDRIGMIGPNGAGKSTLLKIIAETETPDRGDVTARKGIRVGYLEQVPQFEGSATIFTAITQNSGEWEIQSEARQMISRLELDQFGEDHSIEKLSGGWKKRVGLARELVHKPDLLLLDEPTNHLDIESILWLEEFIRRGSFATLTITHDRAFLQKIASRIVEINRQLPGGLLDYQGEYAEYCEIRSQTIAAQEKREQVLKNTLRRETEWLKAGVKARTTKQQARIDRAHDLKDKVSKLVDTNSKSELKLNFNADQKNPKKLIQANRISKAYGENRLFDQFELMLVPGSRVGLMGHNGCGKSTLIRVLLGKEEPDSGSLYLNDNLTISYFDQSRESLDVTQTVSTSLCPEGGGYVDYQGNRLHVRTYMERFLFRQDQYDMPVSELSGGEQSRLLVAKLMLRPANVLVLDEPTNDLDLATLNVLEDCLSEFKGAILLVTHDRYFMDQVCNHIIAFPPREASPSDPKTLISFADLWQWQSWHHEQTRALQDQEKSANKKAASNKSISSSKKKLSYMEQRELDHMEESIYKAEQVLESLTKKSAAPELASDSKKLLEVTEELGKAQAEVERLYQRWSELEEKQKELTSS